MKRTLVTALLLPFFLLTVGSLGCQSRSLAFVRSGCSRNGRGRSDG